MSNKKKCSGMNFTEVKFKCVRQTKEGKCVSDRKTRGPGMNWHSIHSKSPQGLGKVGAQGK